MGGTDGFVEERDDELNWNVDLEVQLFHAMRNHKPVGVNRHFQMVYILDKLNGAVSRKISGKQTWKHLNTMYDLNALNDSEICPFPTKEVPFGLPNYDYSNLMSQNFPRFTASIAEIEDSDVYQEKEGGGKVTRKKTANFVATTTKTAETAASSVQHLPPPTTPTLFLDLESPRRGRERKRGTENITPTGTPTQKRQRRI